MSEIKFLAQLKENERVLVEVFVTQIYEALVYFCERCKKISGRMCECGNFPEAELKISGVISDGTKTVSFQASSEISQKMLGDMKERVEKETIKKVMSRPYLLKGYLKKGNFFIEGIR